jgi:5-(hydroxymethyl)furfural/furfural oxidase
LPFPASYSDRVRKIGVVNAKNKVLTAIAATLMDGPAALRRYMIDAFVVEGFTFDEVMSDDEAMEAFVRKAAIGVWHTSCSCRMGRPDDPMAVVDTQGRVKGGYKVCAWSTPRSSLWCRVPTPTSRP